MNDDRKQQQLLKDVLAESSSPEFRAALLGESLRFARRRRQWRHARQLVGVVGLLLLAGGLAGDYWRGRPTTRPWAGKPVPNGYRMVETQPLPAHHYVDTGQFAAVPVVSSHPQVTEVATQSGGFHYIDDAQLLALTAPQGAILIRTGPHSEELVLADSPSVPSNPPGN
jgi:hypothetical protein